jgi:AcrR family transcriptional regulator
MRLPAAERRRQLITVAIDVFATEGFHESSMNGIAAAAGVTKPVLYQHFESKRALYHAVLCEIGAELHDTIAKPTASADGPRQQIEAGFTAYFRWVADNANAFHVLFGNGTRRDPEFADEARRVEASLAEVVADHITIESLSHGHRLVLGNAIVGMAESACRYWIANDVDVDAETLAGEVSRLAWAGLRGVG